MDLFCIFIERKAHSGHPFMLRHEWPSTRCATQKFTADHLTLALFLEAFVSGQWLKTLDAHSNPKRAAENPLPQPICLRPKSIQSSLPPFSFVLGRFASFFGFHTSIWGCTDRDEKCFERGARRVSEWSAQTAPNWFDLSLLQLFHFIFLSARNWVSDCEFRGQINEFSATIHSSGERAVLNGAAGASGGLEQQC